MIVEGYQFPPDLEASANAWIRDPANSPFKAFALISMLQRIGVPAQAVPPQQGWSPAYRISDRLLQKARREGSIAFAKGQWTATKASS